MTQRRFLTATIAATRETEVEMPWTRGARRAEFISRRGRALMQKKAA